MARNNNVVKMHRKINFNVGVFIFVVIFIYLIASVLIYAFSKKNVIYEVTAGSLSSQNVYNGFILRDETIVNSSYSGSVDYYLTEHKRAAISTLIYSVDETGKVSETIRSLTSTNLSSSDIHDIQSKLNDVTANYDNDNFQVVYDASNGIKDLLNDVKTTTITQNIDSLISTDNDALFHKVEADTSGIISYMVDGYEQYTEDSISQDLFDNPTDNVRNLQNEDLINTGDPAYKLINSNNWNIYIPLDNSTAATLKDTTSVSIRFVDLNCECSADFSIISKDNHNYGKLSLTKYMVNFLDARYVKIELLDSNKYGLKIPNKAIFKRNFYTIPKTYMTDSNGFFCTTYNTDGSMNDTTIFPDIYYEDLDNVYVSTDAISAGTIIKLAGSEDKNDFFVVGPIEELSGVYCVNKGYAVFKVAIELESNDEYTIVQKSSKYGLNMYDHIILDHTTVKEDQLIE